MSFDLYFYKKKGSTVTEKAIARFLAIHSGLDTDNVTEWLFENKATQVYFMFNLNEEKNDPDDIELYECFEDYDNTRFSFNLNFLRPSFFGLEAFQFIDRLIAEFDLFVLNPQGSHEGPYKATKEDLFSSWNQTNLVASANRFNPLTCGYLPEDQSNEIWEYNSRVSDTQEQLGEAYFVPRIFFMKTKKDNQVVTLTTWTQHIPCIIPPTDYVLLIRQYRKMFSTANDTVLISRTSLMEKLGAYFEDFPLKGCKIIRPNNAGKAQKGFNTIPQGATAGGIC